MDWWQIIKFCWGGIGLAAAIAAFVVVWRARGTVSWHRAIQKELISLKNQSLDATPERRSAIEIIHTRCKDVSHSLSPGIGDMETIRAYIRSIAACFFPEAKEPELCISLGNMIQSIDASLARFNMILNRHEFARLKTIRIKTIERLYARVDVLAHKPVLRWYLKYNRKIRGAAGIGLFILPDPLSWLFFLSRRLVFLVLLKLLVMDLYLFLGGLALKAYDRKEDAFVDEGETTLENTLEQLYDLNGMASGEQDPDILEIRKSLVGFPAMMVKNPTFDQWWQAILDAARVVAAKHFPESPAPLKEAALGPLLVSTRSWLNTLAKGEGILIVRYIYKTRLDTLFQAKDLADIALPPLVRKVIRRAFNTYGLLKWPLKAYRWSKKTSLPAIALNVGWLVGKKTVIVLICGRSFDLVCHELDLVYQLSKDQDV